MRRTFAALAYVVACSSASALHADAGWVPGGVQLLSTNRVLAPVEACSDGDRGTFVAWHEQSGGYAGPLRAQHLLPTGDVDPAWPAAGVVVCDSVIERQSLGLLPDQLGGFYAWWVEGTLPYGTLTLFVTRIDSEGVVAPGWPARGRALGSLWRWSPLPSVIEDGSGGVYAVWVATGVMPNLMHVSGIHLGAANTSAGGWPDSVTSLVPAGARQTWESWPQLALAGDGGIYLAWASWNIDSAYVNMAADFLVQRFSPAGAASPEWPTGGMVLAQTAWQPLPFDWDLTERSLFGIAPDGRGGMFALSVELSPDLESGYSLLRRYRSDSAPALDWPAGGVEAADMYWIADIGASGSFRVFSDGLDGAIVGNQQNYTEGGFTMNYTRFGPTGEGASGWLNAYAPGHKVVQVAPGRLAAAEIITYTSPYHGGFQCCWAAFLGGQAMGGWSFAENHETPAGTWFGDMALAPTGDGGAVYFWSQVYERTGLFARRFSAAAELVETPPAIAPVALHALRYVPGEGVHARIGLAGGAGRLELFDLGGRRAADLRLPAGSQGERDVLLPGTAALGQSVYFARLTTAREVREARVVVWR